MEPDTAVVQCFQIGQNKSKYQQTKEADHIKYQTADNQRITGQSHTAEYLELNYYRINATTSVGH